MKDACFVVYTWLKMGGVRGSLIQDFKKSTCFWNSEWGMMVRLWGRMVYSVVSTSGMLVMTTWFLCACSVYSNKQRGQTIFFSLGLWCLLVMMPGDLLILTKYSLFFELEHSKECIISDNYQVKWLIPSPSCSPLLLLTWVDHHCTQEFKLLDKLMVDYKND